MITEFSLPTTGSQPTSITTGADGALWFSETGASKIGRITTAGVIVEFPVPTANAPWKITQEQEDSFICAATYLNEMDGLPKRKLAPDPLADVLALEESVAESPKDDTGNDTEK